MTSVPCPNQDKGICTIPDRTAVIVNGAVSVHSREEVESVLPDLDLNTATLRRLETPIEGSELIHAVDHIGGMAVASADLAQMVERTEDKVSIVVNCSCGHLFSVDVS